MRKKTSPDELFKKRMVDAKYHNVGEFREGLAWVKQGNRHYYVDKEGKAELTADYDEVGDFGNGLAPVRRGKSGIL